MVSLTNSGNPVEAVPAPLTAVSIKKSITPDYLISLEDGKAYKSLKRHLAGKGLTPADYRAKWGLPRDYPMVAPSYSEQRSQLAWAAGLGHTRRRLLPRRRLRPRRGALARQADRRPTADASRCCIGCTRSPRRRCRPPITTAIRAEFEGRPNISVMLGNVTAIDGERNEVVAEGERIAFDYLVVATGAEQSYFGHDDWAPNAPGLKGIDDAIDLRRRTCWRSSGRRSRPIATSSEGS